MPGYDLADYLALSRTETSQSETLQGFFVIHRCHSLRIAITRATTHWSSWLADGFGTHQLRKQFPPKRGRTAAKPGTSPHFREAADEPNASRAPSTSLSLGGKPHRQPARGGRPVSDTRQPHQAATGVTLATGIGGGSW
jgi:hypothetical protein